MGKGSTMPTDPQHTPTILQLTPQPKKTQKPRKPKRKNTKVPQPSGFIDMVTDEAVYKELDDRLVRSATTASSLEAEQDSGNINKIQSKATLNESSSHRAYSCGGPGCHVTIGDTSAQARLETVSKIYNDSLLTRGNTLQSDEDRMKLNELTFICTNLQKRVHDLEDNLKKTKSTHSLEITSLNKKIKKLQKKNKSKTHELKRLYKIGLTGESLDDDVNEDASE
ncbi:hypothetical protein Tco_0818975 [Tanacetum coccineum]